MMKKRIKHLLDLLSDEQEQYLLESCECAHVNHPPCLTCSEPKWGSKMFAAETFINQGGTTEEGRAIQNDLTNTLLRLGYSREDLVPQGGDL